MSNLERIEMLDKARGALNGVSAELYDHYLLSGATVLHGVSATISEELKALREETFGKGESDGK